MKSFDMLQFDEMEYVELWNSTDARNKRSAHFGFKTRSGWWILFSRRVVLEPRRVFIF